MILIVMLPDKLIYYIIIIDHCVDAFSQKIVQMCHVTIFQSIRLHVKIFRSLNLLDQNVLGQI